MNRISNNYNHTIYACYVGYITQAIVNNFAPLLFLTFNSELGISLDKISIIISINFGTQLFIDFISAFFVDKIGYRTCMIIAHLFASAGLAGLWLFPALLPDAYTGILLAVVLYAVGGGLLEVLISPIVEACPTEKKESAMSLLHSFYCWGHVFVIVASTCFFSAFGLQNWRILACIWAVVPMLNLFYFTQVPIQTLVEDKLGMKALELAGNRNFLLLFIMMLCAGASEQGMSQWASAFAESSLHISKSVGDLIGPCMFAFLMGCSRAFYGRLGDKINLNKFMSLSCILCIISYLCASLTLQPVLGFAGCGLCGLSVGILWPGTFNIAAKNLKRGGTAMFALLALAGDLGCGAGPAVVGYISEYFGGDLKKGLLAAVIFPTLLICSCARMRNNKSKQ